MSKDHDVEEDSTELLEASLLPMPRHHVLEEGVDVNATVPTSVSAYRSSFPRMPSRALRPEEILIPNKASCSVGRRVRELLAMKPASARRSPPKRCGEEKPESYAVGSRLSDPTPDDHVPIQMPALARSFELSWPREDGPPRSGTYPRTQRGGRGRKGAYQVRGFWCGITVPRIATPPGERLTASEVPFGMQKHRRHVETW